MAPEDDPLQALYPLLCARCAVSSEVVGAVSSHDFEVDAFLVLVGDASRDSVAEIDLAVGKVQILRVAIVRKDVTLQTEPVSIVLGISSPALGKKSRFGNDVLQASV